MGKSTLSRFFYFIPQKNKSLNRFSIYTGDGENKFIGETSNYYFIFKTKSSIVSVYNKADLALVEVEPNRYRRKEIKDSDNDLKKFLIKLKTKIIK